MRSLTALTIRNLTAHPLRSILTALAIALGVAMVLAASIVGQAATRSATALADEGQQVDLEIISRTDSPFDQSILDTLRARPDVVQVSPLLRVEAMGVEPQIDRLTLTGVDPATYQALHKPELAGGAFLDAPDAIVLPVALALKHSLNVGDDITLETRNPKSEIRIFTLSGRLKLEQSLTVPDSSAAAFAPLEAVQSLAGLPGQIDRVEIVLRPGADVEAVKAGLSQQLNQDLAVVQAAKTGGVELNTFVLQIGLMMTGGIILFAAGFVILNAFVMSVAGRIRELGALRALGMTRRQTMRLVLAEAGVLGLLGTGFGIMAGLGLAWGVMKALGTLGEGEFVVPWWGLLLSSVLGLGVTLLATIFPARRAAHIAPIEAVRQTQPAASDNWYLRAGGRTGALILILMAIILPAAALIGRPNMWQVTGLLGVSLAALLTAAALLLPALIAITARLSRPFLIRRLTVPGRLAADSLSRNRLRAALTVGALTAAFTTIIAASGFMTAFFEVGMISYFDLLHEDAFIIPNLPEKMASGELSIENLNFDAVWGNPLDPALLNDLEALAETGVIQIERMASAPVQPELQPAPGYPAIFVEPNVFLGIGNWDFFEGNPESALALMQRGKAVLVQPIVAERFRAGVGDTIPVQTPQGEIEVTIAGIGGNGWNAVTFPYRDGETYFNVRQPTTLGVLIAEGADREAVVAQLRALLENYPAWTVMDKETDGINVLLDVIDQFKRLLNALLLLAVMVAALGVVNTMVINVSERSREIGLLRAVGATQRQIRRSVMIEGVLFGLLAVVIATVVSFILLATMLGISLPNGMVSMGLRTTWETAQLTILSASRDMGLAALFSLVFGPLIAGLAAYYPAKQAAAIDVVTATRSEHVALTKTTSPRRESRRKMARSLVWTLARRTLDQHRVRAILSVLAVGLGVAMIIATDIIGGAVLNVLAASELAQAIGQGVFEQLDILLTLSGVAVTGVAGFLVFNAFAMSITQRRRQIGSLRSLGMMRRQVMRMVLTEALIIGGVGVLFGLIAGPMLGRGAIALLRTTGSLFNTFSQTAISPAAVILAVVMGVGITLLSVLIPAQRATRISPLEALRVPNAAAAPGNPVGRAALGGLLIIVMAAYLAVSPPGRWVLAPLDVLLTGVFIILWLASLGLILPALIGWLGKAAGRPLSRGLGAAGRLITDNLQRGRSRVTLTVSTMAVALALIVGMTGFMTFIMDELFSRTITSFEAQRGWTLSAVDPAAGMAVYVDATLLSPAAIEDTYKTVGNRAQILEFNFVIVPELSFMGPNYFSFVLNPKVLREAGNTFITFSEGDLETALPVMEAGCGLLLSPLVARNNKVGLGDTLTVQGARGDVECTVAGIGATFVNASIISNAAAEAFNIGEPLSLYLAPAPGVDRAQLEADLSALANRHGINMMTVDEFTALQRESFDQARMILNGMLLLAVITAVLGVANTTVISITERRRELGLLRAVGAKRREVMSVVAGEAALMGLIGGGMGLIAGAGFTIILVVVYGGNSWGIEKLPLWPVAWNTVQPALLNGVVGLIAAPLVSAIAAWFPARSILRGSAIETMQPAVQQAVSARRAAGRLWRWGSLRTRFALGTGVLMALVLAGLITVITLHARYRLQEQLHDAVRTMVAWNAGMVEQNLPEGADNLTLETLTGGGAFGFDADALLRFRSLMDGLTEQGLVDFAIADRDNVTLVSLNVNDIGALLPELAARAEPVVTSTREEGEWLVHAAAPIRNSDGLPVGSVRLTLDAREMQNFLRQLRNGLALAGGGIILLGLAFSWGLTTPLVNAARRLTAHAAEAGRGEFTPFRRSPRFKVLDRLSLRAKLTGAMVFILVLMIVVLQLIAVPIERRRIETTMKRSLVAGAEWIGEAASESFDAARFDLSPATLFTLDEMLKRTQTLNPARLQSLTEQMRSDDVAYIALVDRDGSITFSDRMELIGEAAPAPTETRIEAETWRGDDVWVVSTPLRRGREGKQIGALRMAVRRERVETFLDESRTLFRLTGLIAVLAGVLLAQAIGGAVTAPVRQLVAGTRRVAEGDLSVRFRVEGQDELAILAGAYNQMVAGLREREWLRDMFGRFVSREVAEAIRAGQVKLEGENRVVSILFCDIRGFTERSERHTPAEMVALLNEYLPLVVNAARSHEGTVNKFGGDSTLVIYGAPKSLQESAYRAVQTALEMRANLTRLNERLAERGEAPLRIGVGINTGTVLAGAVGPRERQEYTVIGDTVNLASRIEALNKVYPEYDILISGQTYRALGSRRGEFEFADLGVVPIRGKVEPVQVWGVFSPSQPRQPSP